METRKRIHEPGFYASYPNVPLERVKKARYCVLPESYIVERLVAKRIIHEKTEFYVKWKDWPGEANTWEPSEHIPDVVKRQFSRSDHIDPFLMKMGGNG